LKIQMKRKKRKKASRFLRVFFLGLGCYLFCAFLMSFYQIWQVQAEIDEARQEQQMLLNQKEQLEAERDALEDPEVIEKLARESLGMVKPGEILVVPAVPGKELPRPKDLDVTQILD
jgi:cell division protein DivIC